MRRTRRHAQIVGHFLRTRGPEVAVLQASPFLGAWLGGVDTDADGLRTLALLLTGSTALTAHVFLLNDWAGYETDSLDPRREDLGPAGRAITRAQIGRLAVGLLLVAAVVLPLVSAAAAVTGAVIAGLGLLYSRSPHLGKSTPVAASANHLVGGLVHFLMGYLTVHDLDARGLAVASVFGLVFAAGHLNQEVRDHGADRASGVRTTAVTYGPRTAFLISAGLFSAAYALLVGLAAAGTLPAAASAAAGPWALHLWWSREALRRGMDATTALWIQRRYRLLFGLVGILLLVR